MAAGPGLPVAPAQRKVVNRPVTNEIKRTKTGIPYREITPEGKEASAWLIINETGPKNIAAATDQEIQDAVNKGFAVDTVLAIKRLWAEGLSQAEIAHKARLSISTVKKITPIFKN